MPVFHIFRINDIPDLDVFIDVFQSLARKNNFDGIYFVATGDVLSSQVLEKEEIKGVVGLDFYIKLRYSQYFHFPEGSPFLNSNIIGRS